jgi:phosphodiesterase/alkaline phosphatase D-like protein
VPSLVLGPLLRYADDRQATVWVETDERCTVSVLGHEQPTFCVAGHHYALVHVTGLEPDAITPYEVALDGERVWPEPDSGFPPSVIRTNSRDAPVDVIFGSCRCSYPHEPPYTLTKDEHPQGRELDALRALAQRMREQPPEAWPGALLMLGDQIYADEVHPETAEFIRSRRDPDVPPGEQLAGYHEYCHAYHLAWSDPLMRWLMSTVPTAMIFDDHDDIDDWNTSLEWLRDVRANGWWDERIVGAFASYWVYQHVGNLPPESLAKDDIWHSVCGAEDGEAHLREFAWCADRSVDSTQWSFCRDIGPARLIMIDSRGGRILDPGERSMVDDAEWDFIERHGREHRHDHVLLGTSLPWLLAPGMHHLEAFDEAICDGAWGRTMARAGEKLRRTLDLEHWSAFRRSFERLAAVVAEIGSDATAPATVVALSGDVHHAYLAHVAFPKRAGVRSRVYQAVCSPFRNPLDQRERRAIKAISSKPAAMLTSALARAAGVPKPPIRWRIPEQPVFDNVVATLSLHRRDARLHIERARPHADRDVVLETVFDQTL